MSSNSIDVGQSEGELYRVDLPEMDKSGSRETLIFDATDEASVHQMLVKVLGVNLRPATAREVQRAFEAGHGVIGVDAGGDIRVTKRANKMPESL